MSVTERETAGTGHASGLPHHPQGTALPDASVIDVETLRGRRATNRWERTSVGDVFERLTWARPDEPVLIGCPGAYGDERFASVTPKQADAVANRLAHALAAAGLEPADRVVMICENSVEAFLAKIGIAKAGMVAVPLNPNLAPDVLEHILGLTEPGFAIVDAELWPRVEAAFTATGTRVGATITVGGDPVAGSVSFADLIEDHPDTEPDVEIHGDDIWELLFTSGTTAMPKGVMISHGSTHLAGMNFALALSRGLRHESDLRVATYLPQIYHIGDQLFPFGALLAGGSFVLGRGPAPGPVSEALAAHRVTALWAGSPQFVTALIAELEGRPDLNIGALTMLVYGWGALSPSLLDRLNTRAGTEIVTLGIFGQTEAIACHRFWPTRWPDVHRATAPSVNYVGVPSGLLASDVVDEVGDPVRGEAGEAVYRSPIMTAGYYKDVASTREAFRGGWFHSGDSALVDDAGLRIMVDRYKDIVKTGGENVSSMRVEAILHEHPAVLRAAVIGLAHERWGEAVTAVVVPREGTTPTADDVIAFCKSRLGGYETPKAIVFADALPETVGGKVLKYKLRAAHADLYGPA
ncbi:acyl-CoA synthetase (AMP-forming)/AMP-acid ligase II [Pseudonocardia sediminis]|uniref:Acyl-CoA synthetase (AMP-forming)/AMP-acid ligase II n=1 Tax=Pseudonocardia sediminis TaxID=1397368 RepID=A0A4Q7UUB2_PSEST|nr:AMP-binding protein [Pseudonocardia sediminis]RZT84401.1 acyl-CoA synthetase (AMP-forming)/AMP-acid ligase II [Pseudonocardia sediminis]